MQVLQFKNDPAEESRKALVKMLEDALADVQTDGIVMAVLVTCDADYQVTVNYVTDSPLEVAGLLSTATQGV